MVFVSYKKIKCAEPRDMQFVTSFFLLFKNYLNPRFVSFPSLQYYFIVCKHSSDLGHNTLCMTDKTSVEGIAIWLKQVFGSSSWMAGRVAQELSDDILEVIQTQYPTYHANIRIGLLFALLCIRKGQHQYLRDNIDKVSFS